MRGDARRSRGRAGVGHLGSRRAFLRLLRQDFARSSSSTCRCPTWTASPPPSSSAAATSRATRFHHLLDRVQPDRRSPAARLWARRPVDFLYKPIVPEILLLEGAGVRRAASQESGAQASRPCFHPRSRRARARAPSRRRAPALGSRSVAASRWRRSGAPRRRWPRRPRSWRARWPSATRRHGRADAVERAPVAVVRHRQPAAHGAGAASAGARPVFERLTKHLDLDLYVYRELDATERLLTVVARSGISDELFEQQRVVAVGQGLAGQAAEERRLVLFDASSRARARAHRAARGAHGDRVRGVPAHRARPAHPARSPSGRGGAQPLHDRRAGW